MNFTIGHRQTLFLPPSRVKRPKPLTALLREAASGITGVFCLAALFSLAPSAAAVSPGAAILEERVEGFSPEQYQTAVDRLFASFEEEREEVMTPGDHGKVGLKVYTNSGVGLATPVPLVRAVIDALVERGFSAEDIFLVDQNERRLRKAGFLPGFGEGGTTFHGHPVYRLESGDHYDELWYYESPLPPRREAPRSEHRRGEFNYEPNRKDRLSYLPKPLLLEVDFWINLPMYSDHPVLGINGALVNATLWNASNTGRFFESETSGAAAVAEMAAVPELEENWLFSLATLERFQYVGGPTFRSRYTSSEPVVLLSADPVALDSRMARKINERRKARGFDPIDGELALFDYARQLNLGDAEGNSRPVRTGERQTEPAEEPVEQ